MTTPLEAGLVADDGVVHVALRKVNGYVAGCGVGKIVQIIAGRFDPADQQACPQCLADTTESKAN
ncbi:MAG: hypothetical protein QOJ03_1320 [Frankiaceae bacterium]|nr:hypothetical protein [Frankiaceae bacterium]